MKNKALKNLRLIIPFIALVGILIAVLIAPSDPVQDECSARYRNDSVVKVSSYTIKVEVVQTKQEQQKGLSNRACIDTERGMLFAFEKPGYYSFWMKDMRFPIDIIWIDEDRKVVGIEREVQPSTYPDSFVNRDKPAKYVLELKAGQAKILNINLDTPVNF
ncbi:MAG TPA: DUF192 domain-containing protein [Candidatus Saccharimonadales bacterium]|nr:DUF192 domain-containing protein [Candidatus Saccharimonadales bacterium]